MKKQYSPLVMLLLVSFVFFNQTQVLAQKKEASKNVTTVEHDIKPFTALELKGIFNVFIQQGSVEEVVVEANENVHDYIIVKNEGNKLIIDNENRLELFRKRKLKVFVTVNNLEDLIVTGVGNIKSQNTLKLSELELEVGGAGNVDLDIEVKRLEMEITSAGNIKLQGSALDVEIDNQGVGNLNALKLISKKLKLEASGVGNSKVYATDEISIKATGVGNVSYKGGAEIIDMNVRGVGRVKKI